MDYSSLSSADLLKVCSKGRDASAWEEFVRRFTPLIYGIVTRRLRRVNPATSRDDVDEVAQEVFLKIWTKNVFARFEARPGVPPEAFIATVTAHIVQDVVKAKMAAMRNSGQADLSLDSVHLTPPVSEDGSPESLELEIFHGQVNEALSAQPERDRRIFWLYFQAGLSAPEIARLEGELTAKGVESLIHRMVDRLRKRFFPDRGT